MRGALGDMRPDFRVASGHRMLPLGFQDDPVSFKPIEIRVINTALMLANREVTVDAGFHPLSQELRPRAELIHFKSLYRLACVVVNVEAKN